PSDRARGCALRAARTRRWAPIGSGQERSWPWNPSGLLDHLLVDHLDVLSDAVTIPSKRILRHRGLVLRRELVADLRLHLGQRGAVGRRLLHGRDQVADIAAEERRVALGYDFAVAGNDVCELELFHSAQGRDPVFWVAVVEERHPVDQRVAGGDYFFLRQEGIEVAVGVAPPEDVQLDLATAFLQRQGSADRPRRQRRLHRLQLLQERLSLLQVRLEVPLLRGVRLLLDVGLQLVDLARQGRDLLLDVRDAADAGV